MDKQSPFFRRYPWVKEALDSIREGIQAELPEALHSLPNLHAFEELLQEPDPLRPYLLLRVARHYGCSWDRALRLATSLHMIHAASILHERLGDSSWEGRDDDLPQVHHQHESLDILLGDLFFSKAACIIIEDGERKILEDMIRTSLASAETQAMIEAMEREPGSMKPSRCFLVLADKISLILSLALRVGANLGGAPTVESQALSDYGVLLGRTMRIAQDLGFWFNLPASVRGLPGRVRFSHPLLLLWEEEGGKSWADITGELRSPDVDTLQNIRARLERRGYLKASVDKLNGFAEETASALDRQAGLKELEELRELVGVHLIRPHAAGEEEIG